MRVMTAEQRIVAVAAAILAVVGCGGGPSQATVSPSPARTNVSTRPAATGAVQSSARPVTSPSPTTIEQPSDGAAPSGATERARVVSVADGDTIRVSIDGQEYPVRYIGIDAPERDEAYGRDATRANRQLVDGARVHLERDASDTDQYDRLLRHVWLKRDSGWLLVSAELVRQGLAYAQSYPPDTAYDDVLADAEDEAAAAGLGLWDAAADPTPTAPPLTLVPPVRPAPPAAPDPLANSDCDPSYPTLCLESSPDLDCGQVSARRFPVVGRDPHGFDGDGDGIGCESA